MRIVIFHYHLNPGGVTRIVESQIKSLKEYNTDVSIKIITGECNNTALFENLNIAIEINPELNYLTDLKDLKARSTKIYNYLKRQVNKKDILHFHNLNLGKNPLLTMAIYKLSAEGYNVINHAHDFAEDRPNNYNFLKEIIHDKFKLDLSKVMCPKYHNYNFAVLNSYDRKRLVHIGVSPERVSLLPNPVVFNASIDFEKTSLYKDEICTALNLDKRKKIVTYPVRVIQRKNIGEFILFSVLFSEESNWLVTQPPMNPIEIEPYKKWKQFCENEGINIVWEAGNFVDFEKLISVTDFCITTSIQEGFGMVFMEPWLLNTPVIGRNIPMVTDDMQKSGISFTCLYDRLEVTEGKQMHELKLADQMRVVRQIKSDKNSIKRILKKNPSVKKILNRPDEALITTNKEVILTAYSLSNYGEKLNGIYRRIIK